MPCPLFDSVLLGFKDPSHDDNTKSGLLFCTQTTIDAIHSLTPLAKYTNPLHLQCAPNIWSSYFCGAPVLPRLPPDSDSDVSDLDDDCLFSPNQNSAFADTGLMSPTTPVDDTFDSMLWYLGNRRAFPVPPSSRFFVIKSYSALDVDASLANGLWASTEFGNKRLHKAFEETPAGDIFLFFSVNGSMKFCGVAKMTSAVDFSSKSDIWVESSRWKGIFSVNWLVDREVSNNQFRNLRVPQNENKPVTNSRDTQEIPYDVAIAMLHEFCGAPQRSSK